MRKRAVFSFLLIYFCAFSLISCPPLPVTCSLSYAAVPHLINYQGKLTDSSGTALNGSYNITFRIYDAETAGNLLWQEQYTGVVIQKGIFSVLLGSITALDLAFDKQYYLAIQVGSDPEMSPRQRITSAAYAIRAEHGVPKGVIVMWSGRITDIPSGWALCDGTNGTPDLRDRFIVGARQDDGSIAKTNVTGSLTQSGDGQIPSHTHGLGTLKVESAGEHSHLVNGGIFTESVGSNISFSSANYSRNVSTSSAGTHTHTLTGSTAAVGSGIKNITVYYALAFIMKL